MKKAITSNPKVAVAYLRVSTSKQELGPEAQREAIQKWAAQSGVTIAAWHEDRGVSGGAELDDRPALMAAIDALEDAQAGVLVVAKRDRLARDVVKAAMIEALAEKAGARVLSAAGEGGDDANDPASMMMRGIIDVFAQYERALIRSRTRAALAMKKARGERTGTVRFGYHVAADGKTLERDDAEQAVIERARALRAGGVSIRGIVAALATEGVQSRKGTPIGKATIQRLLCKGAA
ncbi:MAG: recombinase family protein [Deltaproteobacteria bacterium]|nr:recombinase family protein [Deltaproteobacteria bacterium]